MDTKLDIQYFIFMKAATTGRQWEESTNLTTKIVDLSFIAVSKYDLIRGEPKSMPAAIKLSMNFDPERHIQPGATEEHDIAEDYVQNTLSFKQCSASIAAFLELFPKPVCLVSHNGFSFDFKHLKGECLEANVQFCEELLCADSRYLFHHILKSEECKRPDVNLKHIYQTSFLETPTLVTAEDWTLSLLDCVLMSKEMFLDLISSRCNVKLFKEVLPVGVIAEKKNKRKSKVNEEKDAFSFLDKILGL